MRKTQRPLQQPQTVHSGSSRRPMRRRKRRSCLPYILIFLLFVIAACAGALFASSSLFDKPTGKPKGESLLYATDKSVIMIMGIDEHIREQDPGRSDTLMVATLDPKKNQAALLSIPRDTRVRIPGYGFDKVNAAYALGGKKLTQETIENFLGTPMDHYVAIKTASFCRIIDAIGGVDIDVEKRMFYEDPWDDNGGLVIDLKPGLQHMDGKTAITYVRYRDEEGDIGRVKRQQKFMKAVMDQVTSPMIIPRLPSIIREVSNTVDTDLTIRQLLELAGSLKDAQRNGLKTEMVPGKPMYIDEISYWVPDISDVRTALAETLDIKLSSAQKAAMDREELEYDSSIGPIISVDSDGTQRAGKSSGSSRTFTDVLSGKPEKDNNKETTKNTDKKSAHSEDDDEEDDEPVKKPAPKKVEPSKVPSPSGKRM